jgi:L,D-peptidoglycan transpeptidase YkuD (ErfK/YbiS/YcfS/YnhG family)
MAHFIAFSDGRFEGGGLSARCALGKSGVVPALEKREGDGASPIGIWPVRRVWYRPDKGQAPETGIPAIALRADDGWCDAAGHPAYNRPVTLPFPASHERMWRADGVYNLVVELGYNDDPVVAGKGSAIFLHVARPDYAPTEGCVALAEDDLRAVLQRLEGGFTLEIRA